MSKKNIARTAIEGGRAKHCREAEHEATAAERRYYKRYCREAALDPEIDESKENEFAARWETGRQVRDFADKLSPVWRWLEAQVGRPWDKIVSDIKKKFDGRTTAGRHILSHIDGYVDDKPGDNPFQYWQYWRTAQLRRPGDLYVDKHGILRQEPWMSKQRYWALQNKSRK